jgi:hypothetical protein
VLVWCRSGPLPTVRGTLAVPGDPVVGGVHAQCTITAASQFGSGRFGRQSVDRHRDQIVTRSERFAAMPWGAHCPAQAPHAVTSGRHIIARLRWNQSFRSAFLT